MAETETFHPYLLLHTETDGTRGPGEVCTLSIIRKHNG